MGIAAIQVSRRYDTDDSSSAMDVIAELMGAVEELNRVMALLESGNSAGKS
ncbi:MAG TPA: hypothetical protein VFE47_31175 [Tepidisphaeraceae bacterium]|nr:hypothetical protein [Tepidisphaeraceae bacterium]